MAGRRNRAGAGFVWSNRHRYFLSGKLTVGGVSAMRNYTRGSGEACGFRVFETFEALNGEQDSRTRLEKKFTDLIKQETVREFLKEKIKRQKRVRDRDLKRRSPPHRVRAGSEKTKK
jgi:hypothetical protein